MYVASILNWIGVKVASNLNWKGAMYVTGNFNWIEVKEASNLNIIVVKVVCNLSR